MSNLRCHCCKANGRRLEVWVRYGNFSRFHGGRFTPSDYSEIHCLICGRFWRTKSTGVAWLTDAKNNRVFGIKAEKEGLAAGKANKDKKVCPYKDVRTASGRVTFSRAYRQRWMEGWRRGKKEKGGRALPGKAVMLGERM